MSQSWSPWVGRISVAAIVLSAAAIIWSMPIQELSAGVQAWAEKLGPWAVVVFVCAFIVMTVCSLPVWPMPFVAGAVFGTLWGTIISSLSIASAAAAAFGLARFVGRTSLRGYLESSPRMRALERTVEAANWKIVAAVRLSHFLTFGLQNYAFGLTRIPFWTFLITTWLVTLPGTFLQVYVGDLGFTSMESWQTEKAMDWQVWGMRTVGLLAIAGAVIYIGHLGRSTYRKAVKAQLEEAVQEETSRMPRRSAWPQIALVILAVLFVALATWSVIERDALREFIERTLPTSESQHARRSPAESVLANDAQTTGRSPHSLCLG